MTNCSHQQTYSSRGPKTFHLRGMNILEAASRLLRGYQLACRETTSHWSASLESADSPTSDRHQWTKQPTEKHFCIIIIIIWHAPLQCLAKSAANNLQSGLSSAHFVASSTLRLLDDRSFFTVANREVWGCPVGLFQSHWGTAVRILLTSALLASPESTILAKWPNSTTHLFWMECCKYPSTQ